jgi:nitrogen-specific signal transduction histidine kinase
MVDTLKSYTYLDRANLLEVDVHEGLESTLAILAHKLRPGISVHRDYSPDVPGIQAYGSELNQVWTALIDNAVDALHHQGDLAIQTEPGKTVFIVTLPTNLDLKD